MRPPDQGVDELEQRTAAPAHSEGTAAAVDALPLCVGLDETLLLSDIAMDGMISSLFGPSFWRGLLGALVGSRRHPEQASAPIDPATLPYNKKLLSYLQDQRRDGRRLVLVAGKDAGLARRIADHLGLFDEVVSLQGPGRLGDEAAAHELARRYAGGFDFVARRQSDLPIVKQAHGVVLVDTPARLRDEARALGKVAFEIDSGVSRWRGLLRAMRPHQWSKNLLVYVPIITAHALGETSAWISASLLWVGLSATASGLYIVNDLADLAADRRHPRKRNRPLASGAISAPLALASAAVLLAAGTFFSLLAHSLLLVIVYATISLLYSLMFKRFPLIDVFILAGLYTIRIVAGGVASGHTASMWLLAFSGFTFLSLALVKRAGEMMDAAQAHTDRQARRRGYYPEDAAILQMLGCASAFSSSVVLALFVGSTAALQQYRSPELLWAVVPLVLFWQCRLWLATARGNMDDDPIVYTSKDWVSWLVIACALIAMMLAFWGVGIV